MQPSEDYPRMMFHRSKEPVVIYSREEEDGLGPEWSRIIWQASAIAEREPAPALPEPPEPPPAGYAAEDPEAGGPAHQVEPPRNAARARKSRALPKPPAKPATRRSKK